MHHKSVYWKNSLPIIEKVMNKYGFIHVKLDRLPYNRNDMLFKNVDHYVIFSLFDDYRDPCNSLGITLGFGEIDNPQKKRYSSVPFTNYAPQHPSYFDIERSNWNIETEKVLVLFETAAADFLNGDSAKVIELAKKIHRKSIFN